MSNYLAIATITATLQRILQASIQGDVDGARVTTLQPRQIGNGTPETGINLFLYHVKRNNAFGNADTATHRAKANLVKRQSALDLHYIVSCYGNETELEPQRLLGSVVRIFNDRPTVALDVVQATIADPSFRFLAEADLTEQIQQLNICPIDLSLDDLSKVWSVFFQAPYLLSAVYKVTVVTIDGEESLPKALPVRDRKLGGVAAFPHQPIVESVHTQAGKLAPILATSILIIRGRNLESASTLIRIGEAQIAPSQCSDTQSTVSLAEIPAGMLRAGAQGLQVIHQIPLGTTFAEGTSNIESNLTPFVLRPTIEQVCFESQSRSGDEYCTGLLSVRVDVRVGIKQRVILILNEWSIETAIAYQFAASHRELETDTIEILLEKVKPGDYLLRLQIDGAESVLEVDTDPASPTFDWFAAPRVRLA